MHWKASNKQIRTLPTDFRSLFLIDSFPKSAIFGFIHLSEDHFFQNVRPGSPKPAMGRSCPESPVSIYHQTEPEVVLDSASINISPMANVQNDNLPGVRIDLINDPIVADPDSMRAFCSCQLAEFDGNRRLKNNDVLTYCPGAVFSVHSG